MIPNKVRNENGFAQFTVHPKLRSLLGGKNRLSFLL